MVPDDNEGTKRGKQMSIMASLFTFTISDVWSICIGQLRNEIIAPKLPHTPIIVAHLISVNRLGANVLTAHQET